MEKTLISELLTHKLNEQDLDFLMNFKYDGRGMFPVAIFEGKESNSNKYIPWRDIYLDYNIKFLTDEEHIKDFSEKIAYSASIEYIFKYLAKISDDVLCGIAFHVIGANMLRNDYRQINIVSGVMMYLCP